MKVSILTEGGINIGFGHVGRCCALYEAFEAQGILPNLILNADKTIGRMLKGKRYKILNWLKEKDEAISLIGGSDISIVDSYLAPVGFYDMVSKICGKAVYIDDTKRIRYPKGIVVNGAIGAEKIKYPKCKNIRYLVGSKYALLRKEFWRIPDKKTNKDVRKIMLVFGGNDARNITPKVLRMLSEIRAPFKKAVIISRAFNNIEEIKELKDKNTELVFYPDVKEMKKVMIGSDLAISAAGQTLYELARIGVPTISITIAKNQMTNVEGWRDAGFIEDAGWCGSKATLNNISKSLTVLSARDERLARRNIGRALIDGKGACRVLGELLN